MATNIIDAFIVTFGINTKGFDDGADEVERRAKRTRDKAVNEFGDIERAWQKMGNAFRSGTTQLLGMFLAFQGASSITSLISGMIQTTAAADRMGQSIGMAGSRVIAWRMAMKNVGGQAGEADQALGAMNTLKQDWAHGQLGGQQAALLASLGINQADLKKSSPENLLYKLAGAKRPYGDAEYANRLSQLGLSQNAIYLLMQGADTVRKQTEMTKEQMAEYEKQAKEAEDLQKSMAELNKSVATLLVPALNQLVPVLTDLTNAVNEWLHPGSTQPAQSTGFIGTLRDMFTIKHGSDEYAESTMKYLLAHGVSQQAALGAAAGVSAEGGSLGMAANGAFGIGQWRGDRAKRLFSRYGNAPTLEQQQAFLLWELQGGDIGGKRVLGSRTAAEALGNYIGGFMRPQGKNWEHRNDYLGDIRRGSRYLATHTTVNVDARGHQNPQAVERAARAGVSKGLAAQAGKTVQH